MRPNELEPLTVTVPVALMLSGLGRTKFYECLAKHEIESVRVGTRRLINYASLKAFRRAGGLNVQVHKPANERV